MTPGIIVTGASGRMGRTVAGLLRASGEARLVGALERPGHPWVGRDLGECLGGAPWGVVVEDDPLDAFARAQGVIDFTAPDATAAFADLAAQARAVHVVGTTGLSPSHLRRLSWAAHHAVIVRAGNFGVGINVLLALVRRAAAALPGWDAEVLEAHHRAKLDAPSGTALMLGAAVAEGRGVRLEDVAERGRDGEGRRAEGAIGFASLRGGDIVGEHDVVLAGEGERVVLRHVATDRAVFARGAIRAVLWGQDRAPGEYAMTDVLGL